MSAISWRRLLRVLVLCALIPAMNAGADAAGATASADTIREGNRAFRDGNYEAAISRYLAAHPQGEEGAVARFNLGVAYYRLGDYAQAEWWLLRSAQDSRFSLKARYNLGLVYWARGNTRSAQSEFKAVERFSQSRQLRSLAHQGLREINRGADSPALRRSRATGIDEGYSVRASMSYGNDDNVFHSPDAPYLDLTQPGPPLVTPTKFSGAFAEADVTAQNILWSGRHVLLRTAYDFNGRYYTDRQFQNADEYTHRLSVSARKASGPQLDRTLLIRMNLGHHDETNFDPDNGQERVAAGEDISGRFKYWKSVAAADYERPFGRVTVAIRGMTELRDYGNVQNVSEYDNMLFLAGVSARMKVLPRTELKLEYDRSMRKYRERKALNADGSLVATNPTLDYEYDTLSLTALIDFGRTGLEIGYDRSDRTDTYVGYNDYRRGSFRITGSWQPSRRLRLEVTGFSSSYDYPNAFAFDVPQGGAKTLDYTQAELRARFSITRNLELVAEARYWDVSSSDPRIAYSRSQAPIGLSWTQRF
jgi:tetratricopeptide (TPR) repeat protein